jgi:hypothetical protein
VEDGAGQLKLVSASPVSGEEGRLNNISSSSFSLAGTSLGELAGIDSRLLFR